MKWSVGHCKGKRLFALIQAHKKSSLCIMVAILLVLSAGVSGIHNLIYFSKIAVITEEEIEKFAASRSDMECMAVGEEDFPYPEDYKSDRFLYGMRTYFVFQLAMENDKKQFDYYLEDSKGRYRIAAFQLTEEDDAAEIFERHTHDIIRGKKSSSWLFPPKSEYAEYFYYEVLGTFYQAWYCDRTMIIILSDSEEYGILLKQELIDYVKQEGDLK